jgi:predicted acetyltransferase
MIGSSMDVTRHEASADDALIARNLSSYYVYDMSEHMGWPAKADGTFGGCDDLESYWIDPRKHAFMLRAGDEAAGFVLILANNAEADVDYSVTDFFVLRKFRGQGVGQRIAHELFNRFRGRWKVEQFSENKPAVAFWEKTIDRYTGGKFERSSAESRWGEPLNVLRFTS